MNKKKELYDFYILKFSITTKLQRTDMLVNMNVSS